MKENAENNQLFFDLHFQYREKGYPLKDIRAAVKNNLNIKDDHIYRARLSALANPKRYGGRFVSIREFMKNQKQPIELVATQVIAPLDDSIQLQNDAIELIDDSVKIQGDWGISFTGSVKPGPVDPWNDIVTILQGTHDGPMEEESYASILLGDD